MIVQPMRTKRERDYPKILATTLNGQDRMGTLGWLAGIPHDRPSRVQGFGNPSQRTRDAAIKEFLETLRGLADQWIASGKEHLKSIGEQPWTRNVLWFSDDYQESIDRTLRKFLDRYPLPIVPDSAGRFAVAYWEPRDAPWPFPEPALEDTLVKARDLAILEFQKFLESDCAQRLFKCNKCGKYFALARKPREVIQHGAYCKDCKSAGGARRVEDKRNAKKQEMLKLAAEAWIEWKPSHSNPNQCEWVARQVKKRCRVEIQGKWVSRNLKKILERAEALKSATD
jgi:hypothetical protein